MSSRAPSFYFAAMSPYSWIAAERIEEILPEARWRGVLAGAIFAAHGRTSWGLTDERERSLAECEQRAQTRGLGAIHWPEPWPTSDLQVARAMVIADQRGLLKPFALAAMRMAFREGADLSKLEVVLEAGARVEIDPAELGAAISDPLVKQALREVNDEALAAGVFGVPTVVIGEQLFWGDDRLEDAAAAHRVLRDG